MLKRFSMLLVLGPLVAFTPACPHDAYSYRGNYNGDFTETMTLIDNSNSTSTTTMTIGLESKDSKHLTVTLVLNAPLSGTATCPLSYVETQAESKGKDATFKLEESTCMLSNQELRFDDGLITVSSKGDLALDLHATMSNSALYKGIKDHFVGKKT